MDATEVAEPRSSELDVLSAAREGSLEAGRSLVAEYGPSMVRTAWNVLGGYGGNEVDDVVQEAFIAALTTATLPKGDLGAWLRAITVRKALDWVRRVRRRREEPLPEPETKGELISGWTGATQLEVLAVRQALRQLSPADRAVLTLVDLEEHSMAETAAILGLSNVAVRLRAVRARRKLRRLLRAAGDPEGAA